MIKTYLLRFSEHLAVCRLPFPAKGLQNTLHKPQKSVCELIRSWLCKVLAAGLQCYAMLHDMLRYTIRYVFFVWL